MEAMNLFDNIDITSANSGYFGKLRAKAEWLFESIAERYDFKKKECIIEDRGDHIYFHLKDSSINNNLVFEVYIENSKVVVKDLHFLGNLANEDVITDVLKLLKKTCGNKVVIIDGENAKNLNPAFISLFEAVCLGYRLEGLNLIFDVNAGNEEMEGKELFNAMLDHYLNIATLEELEELHSMKKNDVSILFDVFVKKNKSILSNV